MFERDEEDGEGTQILKDCDVCFILWVREFFVKRKMCPVFKNVLTTTTNPFEVIDKFDELGVFFTVILLSF